MSKQIEKYILLKVTKYQVNKYSTVKLVKRKITICYLIADISQLNLYILFGFQKILSAWYRKYHYFQTASFMT